MESAERERGLDGVSELRLEHIGLWVRDLERMREFYVTQLGGQAGQLYENPRTGFRSYFISFGQGHGPRLELMSQADRPGSATSHGAPGYAHVAFSLGSTTAVDETIGRLESAGVVVVGRPRITGDGYYEGVVDDPEGNRIEFVGERRSLTNKDRS